MYCKHGTHCSGCPWIDLPYTTQLENKKILPLHSMLSIGETRFRERLDLSIKDGVCGLYDRSHTQVVPLEECPILSLELEAWLLDFKKTPPPIKKGSVRLRVAPDGTRGAWLDFANLDVKALLEGKTYLTQLLNGSVVEIGQRHKRLGFVEGQLKLLEPELAVWSETFAGETSLPLYLTIGSFTQTGRKANRALTDSVRALFPDSFPQHWIEFGSGCGTFTLPLLKWGAKVKAFEIDERALSGLERSAVASGLRERLTFERKSFTDKSLDWKPYLEGVEALLMDPPRSGIGPLLTQLVTLPEETLPPYLVYISCFRETFESDAKILTDSFFTVSKMIGVDQFPHTPHCEYVALFEKRCAK